MRKDKVRTRVPLPLAYRTAEAEIVSFCGLSDPGEHVAVIFGILGTTPLVRIHSECLTGDVIGSLRCDCGPQLREAIGVLQDHGGILLYMRQEGRGIGLYNKLDAYALQDSGVDTFAANRLLGLPADARSYQACAEMLTSLGVHACRLLTNNPQKVAELRARGLRIDEVVPTGYFRQPRNAAYLDAKRLLAGHFFRDLGASWPPPIPTGPTGAS
jgi:GTP cyclohydrolase II